MAKKNIASKSSASKSSASKSTASRFETKLLRPAEPRDASWAFVVLPAEASARLPRRGRTTVEGTLNGQAFRATLEPDGKLSHWLKVDEALREAAGAAFGDTVALEIAAVAREPEPELPPDLRQALDDAPAAWAAWESTTPWHASTGSTGSSRSSRRPPAPSGSPRPATSLLQASGGSAASTRPATTARR